MRAVLVCYLSFYLGGGMFAQEITPLLFGEGLISTSAVEYASAFSSEVNEIYFARSFDQWGKGKMMSTVYYSRKQDGKWTEPTIAPFSGTFDDSGPHLSVDGKALFFISKRPSTAQVLSADIWLVRKDRNNIWGIPVRLKEPINSDKSEYSPTTTSNGDLYFASNRPGGFGQGDLYLAPKTSEGYTTPVNLGKIVNSPLGEWNLELSNDGEILLFEASQRKQNKSAYGDLYLSFKKDNQWTIPQNISELNTTGSDLYPELVNNKKTLFYSSSQFMKSTDVNIYAADFGPIYEKYLRSALVPRPYLLVVNRSGHELAIIDLETKNIIRKVKTGFGPHELAISSNRENVFIANYGSFPKPHSEPILSSELEWAEVKEKTVTALDLTNGKTSTIETTGSFSPHGIVTNHDGSVIWVTDENNGRVKEINTSTGELFYEYSTMKGSHIVVANPDRSILFVSNIESNTVSCINIQTREVQHINTPKGPEGMALSPDGKELWILANQAHKIAIYSLERRAIIEEFDSHGRFPVKLAFTNGEAWISNVSSRNIAIFDYKSKEFKEEIKLETTPLSIISHLSTVYVSLPRKNLIAVIDVATRKRISEFSPGIEPDGMMVLNDIGFTLERNTE